MEDQIALIDLMFKNIKRNAKQYSANIRKDGTSYLNGNYMNKNHGKYALKRKIILLRQELKNLERMIDDAQA